MSTTVAFQPIVTLTLRDDGRWDAEIDWADSCLTESIHPSDRPSERDSEAACDAVDAWRKTQPKTFIIPAAPPPS